MVYDDKIVARGALVCPGQGCSVAGGPTRLDLSVKRRAHLRAGGVVYCETCQAVTLLELYCRRALGSSVPLAPMRRFLIA